MASTPSGASTAVVLASPLSGLEKYFNLAASAAITAQKIAANAPNESKMNLALDIVNSGLGFAATVQPTLIPALSMAAGLESPMASLISGIVQIFKAHGLHGFTPSKSAPAPAPDAGGPRLGDLESQPSAAAAAAGAGQNAS